MFGEPELEDRGWSFVADLCTSGNKKLPYPKKRGEGRRRCGACSNHSVVYTRMTKCCKGTQNEKGWGEAREADRKEMRSENCLGRSSIAHQQLSSATNKSKNINSVKGTAVNK
jgi:hypothetical protein